MKRALIAIAISLLPGAASAGSSCYYIGSTMYCNGDNGSSATGYNIGSTTYYNGRDANGQTWQQSCYYIGQTRYCN